MYAPTISHVLLKMMTVIGLSLRMNCFHFDVTQAFLIPPIEDDELIYTEIPKGFHTGSQYYRLRKPLYGLTSAPVRWFEHMSVLLLQKGLQQSEWHPCLFYEKGVDGKYIAFVCVFVDNVVNIIHISYTLSSGNLTDEGVVTFIFVGVTLFVSCRLGSTHLQHVDAELLILYFYITIQIHNQVLTLSLSYNNDFKIFTKDHDWVKDLLEFMKHNEVNMKESYNGKYLGMQRSYDLENRQCSVSQEEYIDKTLEAFGMEDCKPAVTAAETDSVLPIHKKDEKQQQYGTIVGKLMHVSQTRLECGYSVKELGRPPPKWIGMQ